MKEYATSEFRMGAAKFASEIIFRYAAPWLLSLSAIGVIGVVMGVIVDYRWLFAVLFLIFVIAPMLLVLLYYYFGLRREAYVNTVHHKIIICEEGMLFKLRFMSANKDSADGVDKQEEHIVREEFFKYSEMLPMKIGFNSVSVPLRAPAKGFLWIPRRAFESDDDMADFFKILESRIQK